MGPPHPIHAIVVGINDYPELSDSPPLKFACSDAIEFRNVLIEIGAKKDNITILLDSAATKRAIIDRIDSLTDSDACVKRGDAIIFFFSGYAIRTSSNDGGFICAYDTDPEIGGISDSYLLETFDRVAKSCGNNIVCLLCQSIRC